MMSLQLCFAAQCDHMQIVSSIGKLIIDTQLEMCIIRNAGWWCPVLITSVSIGWKMCVWDFSISMYMLEQTTNMSQFRNDEIKSDNFTFNKQHSQMKSEISFLLLLALFCGYFSPLYITLRLWIKFYIFGKNKITTIIGIFVLSIIHGVLFLLFC